MPPTNNPADPDILKTIASLAQVVVALCNLSLAIYVFGYQRTKDKKTSISTAKLNEQNIKLQWFKELVIQPNFVHVEKFFNELHSVKNMITANDLSSEQKQDINDFIKLQQSQFRKAFLDVLMMVDKTLGKKFMDDLDELVDHLTNTIFNDELKLMNPSTFEKYISSKISYAKNNLIASIFNYQGI